MFEICMNSKFDAVLQRVISHWRCFHLCTITQPPPSLPPPPPPHHLPTSANTIRHRRHHKCRRRCLLPIRPKIKREALSRREFGHPEIHFAERPESGLQSTNIVTSQWPKSVIPLWFRIACIRHLTLVQNSLYLQSHFGSEKPASSIPLWFRKACIWHPTMVQNSLYPPSHCGSE